MIGEISKDLEKELLEVNNHIDRLCFTANPTMNEVMGYILSNKGKQIRPILTILCSRLKGRKPDVSEIAAVIEICHTASLIHDDIIDKADMRRGKMSVYKKFGSEMAVYAGDFMIFATLGRTDLRLKPWYRDMFSKLEKMCEGEVSQFDNEYNFDITENDYFNNILGKTSAMFGIACCSGAIEGGCSKEDLARVEQFANDLGILFQLRDDLFDFINTKEQSLKSVQGDFRSGYYTLPAIYTFKSFNKLKLIEMAAKFDAGIDATKETYNIIEEAGGFAYTKGKIYEYYERLKRDLSYFANNDARKHLTSLVDYLYNSAVNA